MALPAGAFVMKNCLVKFGATEYTNQVQKARLVPEVNIQTIKTLVPDGVIQDVDTPTWTFEMTAIQDYVASQGLARYLLDNSGTSVVVTLEPIKDGATWTFTAILVPGEVGGEQGGYATIEVTMPVLGQPAVGT